MANENNLLRPPVLNQDEVGVEQQARQQQRQAQRQLEHQQNRGTATMKQLTALVSHLIAQQVPRIVHAINNPEQEFNNAIDQVINEDYHENLGGLGYRMVIDYRKLKIYHCRKIPNPRNK